MKKLKLWFKAIAVALLSFITAPAYADLSEILASGKVKIGVGENFAPFSSLGDEGEHVGFDVDVAKLIAKDLGVELELIPITSKQRIPYLETDKADLVIASMGANPGRAKSIWFSSAYAPFFSGAFAAEGLKIGAISDLSGYKVGLTAGTLEDLELTENAPAGTEIISLNTGTILPNKTALSPYFSNHLSTFSNFFSEILNLPRYLNNAVRPNFRAIR